MVTHIEEQKAICPEDVVEETEHGLISASPDYLHHTKEFEDGCLTNTQDVIDEEEILDIEDFTIGVHNNKINSVHLLIVSRCIAQYPKIGVSWEEIWEVTGFDEGEIDCSVDCLISHGLVVGTDRDDLEWGTEREVFYPSNG